MTAWVMTHWGPLVVAGVGLGLLLSGFRLFDRRALAALRSRSRATELLSGRVVRLEEMVRLLEHQLVKLRLRTLEADEAHADRNVELAGAGARLSDVPAASVAQVEPAAEATPPGGQQALVGLPGMLLWWNEAKPSAPLSAADMDALAAAVGASVTQLSVANPLFGFVVNPPISGSSDEAVLLPNMRATVGSLSGFFEGHTSGPNARVHQVVSPAFARKDVVESHGRDRGMLSKYGKVRLGEVES